MVVLLLPDAFKNVLSCILYSYISSLKLKPLRMLIMLYSIIQSPLEKNGGDSLHLFHSIDAAGSKHDLSSFVSLSFFAPKTGSPARQHEKIAVKSKNWNIFDVFGKLT